MPALNITNKIILTIDRVENGFVIGAAETGSNEKYVADSSGDLPVQVDTILTEWADRVEPVEGA